MLGKSWARTIEMNRREKDEFFRTGHGSPIPHGEHGAFRGLMYFPPDERYRFQVRLSPVQDPTPISMSVSQGEPRTMYRAGFFEFEVHGTKVRLFAYRSKQEHGHEALFVPFRDSTSGKESYGAGRYLDLPVRPDGAYVLDFNEAYNPYCAYSENYSCPLPPVENWLRVPIPAGEKSYH